MAKYPGLVSRTAWYQIAVASAILLLVISCSFRSKDSGQVYQASDDDTNFAVIEGVMKADAKAVLAPPSSKAVIVPHHLVASEAIALGIKSLASSSPRFIVLISPDHFHRCPKLLCTTKGSFQTFFGDVLISGKAVDQMLSYSDVVVGSDLFRKEHGINAVVPFIKHYLPEARIVPIVVSQQGLGSRESRLETIRIIQKLLEQKDSSLVVSSDFSHYLPLMESDAMDEKTRISICSGNSQEILSLRNPDQSDCPLCLWILEQTAKLGGFWNPVLVWHSNSAHLLHNTSVQETTSHFTFVFSEIPSVHSCSMPSSG